MTAEGLGGNVYSREEGDRAFVPGGVNFKTTLKSRATHAAIYIEHGDTEGMTDTVKRSERSGTIVGRGGDLFPLLPPPPLRVYAGQLIGRTHV